jgi:ligand-binding sensor domain-containing protein
MYGVEDGLASREVFCGLQDDDGFMWFGTRNGLNRFDGKHFKLFSKQKNGLAENRIFQLAKDDQHHLFIVYENPAYSRSVMKIEVMDLKTNKLSSLKEAFPNLPFDENYVYWVSNADNNIAFLISKPFQYWQLEDGKFKLKAEMKAWDNKETNPNDLLTANGSYHTTTGMHCLFSNKDALLFLSDNLPFYFFSQDSLLTFNHFEEQGIITVAPEHKLLFHNATNVGYIHANGSYENHIATYHPPIQQASFEIFYRNLNHHNLLAYTSTDGLYLYDFKQWYKLLSPGELKISGGNALYGGYIDKQNNYWIFSSNGLAKIRVVRNPFTYYFTKAQLQMEGNNQARGIYSDGNKVYANIWDRFYWITDNTSYKTMADKEILYGVCRHNNKIYTGSQILHELDEKRHTISNQIVQEKSGDFWALDSLSPEQLIVGTTKDIRIFYPKTKAFQTVEYNSPDIPKVNFVYRLFRGKNKNIWAVAHNGLYRMDEHANKILEYWGKEGMPSGNNTKARVQQFPFQTIFDAYEDPEGIWWFATCSDGLFRWNRTENSFQQFTSAHGLPSDILYRIESDAYGNLWISTDNGLVRFNTKNYKTNTYNTTNGISHNEFNRASSFKDKDGRLFFGGLDGVNAFYPSHFIHDSTVEAAPLRIITFHKFSEKENKLLDQTNEILLKNKIILHPGDRFFNLEFQLLDYIDGNLNYAYKIEGVDKDWNYINENSIRISGLPYGIFCCILKVRRITDNGVPWNCKYLLRSVSPFTCIGGLFYH